MEAVLRKSNKNIIQFPDLQEKINHFVNRERNLSFFFIIFTAKMLQSIHLPLEFLELILKVWQWQCHMVIEWY